MIFCAAIPLETCPSESPWNLQALEILGDHRGIPCRSSLKLVLNLPQSLRAGRISMTVDLERVPSVPPKAKLKRNLFVLILMGLGVYIFLPQFARIEHAFQIAATLRIPFLALSTVAQILSYLGSGYLLRTVVKLAAKPISIVDGALLTAGANSVGTLGGGVIGTAGVTYLWLRRRGVNAGAAGLAGWLPIFLNQVVLVLISLAGLAILLFLKKSSGVLIAGLCFATLFLVGGTGFLLWCSLHRERLVRIAMKITDRIAKLRHKPQDPDATGAAVHRLLEGWDALLQGGWHGPATGALLNTGFDVLTLAFLFVAAGNRVSIIVLVAGYGVPQLLGKLTLILGGIGVVEATMIALYDRLGVPPPVAVVVVLAYRLLSFWLPTLLGIVLATYFERASDVVGKSEEGAGERPSG
jgi:glycosyltransferase 2 family protein